MLATASCSHGNFICCQLPSQLDLPLQRLRVLPLTPSLTFLHRWQESQKTGLLLPLFQLTSHYRPVQWALSSCRGCTRMCMHTYTHTQSTSLGSHCRTGVTWLISG